jgi:enoyl-[acyl-carrier protein] reductase II
MFYFSEAYMSKISDKFFKRGAEFLGSQYPIICGAMAWVSEPKLVSSVCNAGGFGMLAGGGMPTEMLEKSIDQMRTLTDKPFGVNVITLAPNFQTNLEMLKRKKPAFVVFAGGLPKNSDIEAMKEVGSKCMCFAPNVTFAKRMIKAGADALLIEGMESGGHIGLVTTSVLVQEILFEFGQQLPVFVAGGIATGKLAAHMFMLGAAGVQMGTRFACATESHAHEAFKKRYIEAQSREAYATSQFDTRLPVVGVRAIKNKGTDDFNKLQLELVRQVESGTCTREHAQEELEKFWLGSLRKAVIDGDTEYGSLMAGQCVGLVGKSEPVKDIIADIVDGVESEMQRVKSALA